MSEYRRIFHKKMIFIIIAASMLNLCFFMYGQMKGRSISQMMDARGEAQNLIDRYKELAPEEAKERFTKENTAVRAYINGLRSGTEIDNNTGTESNLDITMNSDNQTKDITFDEGSVELIDYYKGLSDNKKSQFEKELKNLMNKLNYLDQYRGSMDQIISRADYMKKFPLFADPDSYSYNNIIRTAEDFSKVSDLELVLVNDRAVDEVTDYYYIFYIAFAIMVIVIYALLHERENGMWCMVHSAPYGRGILAAKRFVLILSVSFAVSGVIYWSTFLLSMLLHGGWRDLGTPVQTIETFQKCTFLLSKGEYVLINFLLGWFAVFVLSILLWMLFTVFRKRNHTLIFTGVLIGIEWLLFDKIPVQSIYNHLKYVNVVNLFRMNEVLGSYNNWGFTRYVFSVLNVTLLVLFIMLAAESSISIIMTIRMRPDTQKSIITKLFMYINIQYQKIFQRFPVTVKELHKLVITGKGVWVVAAVIIMALYFTGTGRMNFNESDAELDKIYMEHGGKEYSYISGLVLERKNAYDEAVLQRDQAWGMYENGEIDRKALSNAVSNFNYHSSRLSAVSEFDEKIEYVNRIEDEYQVEVYLISDRGYEEIFGQYGEQREYILLITLVTGIMLIISECIVMEYRTGMEYIVRSCEKGRNWILVRKTAACIIFTVIIFVVVYGIDLWRMHHFYGMPFLEAPLMSLTFMEGIGVNVSIIQWITLRLAVRLAVCLLAMAIAMITSRFIGKKGSRALIPLILAIVIVLITFVNRIGGI